MNTEQNIETPFNEEFCGRLEYRICNELKKSKAIELRGFWCDGISCWPNEKQLTKKYVNDKRKIDTIAWIGKTGQDEYQATIHFGKKSLSSYAKGSDLNDSIPELDSLNEWLEIDIEKKTIEIKLN